MNKKQIAVYEKRGYENASFATGYSREKADMCIKRIYEIYRKKLLEDGKDAILMELQNEDEEKWIAEYNLLTSKPVIYAANVAEDDLADDGANNSYVQSVREYAKEHNSEVFVICAEIEAEISELEEDEKKMFLEDLGLTESGLEKLIAASYRLLGLMSFLTAG